MMATARAKIGGDIFLEAKINRRIGIACSFILLATTASLLSCKSNLAKHNDVIETRIICTVLEPIKWRDADTAKTRADINAYNTVWNYYCDHGRWLENQEQLKKG